MNIHSILSQLSQKRPIFHSEADFQHALAWEIHNNYPNASIRLEINPYVNGQRAYIDILTRIGKTAYAIELKYKTRKLDTTHSGEAFHLLNQSAQDLGRYDFIKDVVRLERFIDIHPNAKGFAIFLTNDSSYWKEVLNRDTVDQAFRLYENRMMEGKLIWGKRASAGTIRGRENYLSLSKKYHLRWNNFSQLSDDKKTSFKYLLLEI